MTSGKRSDIVKQEIETDLRKYVRNQLLSDPAYIRKMVSLYADECYMNDSALNELIAEVLLQKDKNEVKDPLLLELVERCIL